MDTRQSDNREKIGAMFDNIAGSYDFLNHFLSFGTDKIWRRRAVSVIVRNYKKARILDVATGTGDLSIAALRADPEHITGIDISEKMLELGNKKILKRGLKEKISLLKGASEELPFVDNSFDVSMSAFGVRNFSDTHKGLSEMTRVIRPGGMVLILEFSRPAATPFRQIYNFYFLKVLPLIGRIFSKDRSAYSYLPDSVMKFPDNELFIELMKSAGLGMTRQQRLSGGIASIYTGIKPGIQ